MKDIMDGLEILYGYYPSASFAAEHDQIVVYSWKEEVEVSDEDKRKLSALGWFMDDDESWSCFC